ncbi:hypothetical protein HMI54_008081 [Coelomomyces lativittatus]|nr:hypothetical protein HMI54_008081 [Coelomomyces lativittatus]
MVRSVRMEETTERMVSAFSVNEPQDVDMNRMTEKANLNFLTYRETTERANDLLMDAFVSGTTEVPNSVLLSHPEIFKRHRSLQLNSRKKTEGTGHRISNLEKGPCPLEDYLQYDVSLTKPGRENVISAPCGYINLVVNGKPVRALWDSGAEVNLIRASKAREIGVNIIEGATVLRGFDGTSTTTTGTARSVHVDIGGVQGLLYFIVVENANDDIVLGRPFEVAFQTTSAVLGDGTYTGTVQNHDGSEKVTLAVLKGPVTRESRSTSNFDRYPTGTAGLCEAFRKVDFKKEDKNPGFRPQKTSPPAPALTNNKKKNSLTKEDLLKKIELKYNQKKEKNESKRELGKLICNIMNEIEDAETLQEIDDLLINSDSNYSPFDHLIQLDLQKKEDVYLKVRTLNTVRKRVAEKVRPQNVPLPEDAYLDRERESEPTKVWDRLTPENVSKIKAFRKVETVCRDSSEVTNYRAQALAVGPDEVFPSGVGWFGRTAAEKDPDGLIGTE